jgi:hypothetical protein
MLYGEIIAVYSQFHIKHMNTLCEQNVEMLNVKPGSTYSDHWTLGIKRNMMGSYVVDWYAKGWAPLAGCCERGDEPSNCHIVSGVI